MGRPRGFDVEEVVAAAADLFWECGYQRVTVVDLERATCLNRSSLYQAFGAKDELFGEALALYIDSFIAPRLAAMERAGARPRDVIGFFRGLARLFRDDPHRGRRGCLWVNAIAEFTNRGPQFDVRADGYRHRLWAAFANALSEEAGHAQPHSGLINRRSRMLTATTFGIWLTARFDPNEAARVCDCVAAEVRSWKGTNRTSTSALRESR
jgi:TetR/AcrR family transcriptional repressor of nem operon